MVEFSCEVVWSLAYFCWKISDYSWFLCLWWVFYFLFLPESVLESYSFLRICLFLPNCPFYWHIAAGSSLTSLCISVLSVVISPFSFLILLIWFFSLCFLMSLDNGLSILFTFSKKQLLALLIFAMVSLVSFAFISALIFKIYFFLLTLGFFISSFSSCFRCRARLFIWLFSCFLR